jgi:type IV pilus assembly protein PilB
MPPIKTFGERIADALVEDGLLTPLQIQELLEQQKKDGTRLLKLILEKSYVKEMDMVVSMGRVLNTPPVNLARVGIPQEVAELVPREIAENHKVLPVSRLGDRLFLAMADPLNVLALDDVKRITKLEVTPLMRTILKSPRRSRKRSTLINWLRPSRRRPL